MSYEKILQTEYNILRGKYEALKIERAKAVKLAELATKSMYEHKKEIARLKNRLKELAGIVE